MNTRGSVRRKSKSIFQKVISLRKQGFSYSEIKKETGVAKTTINNWLAYAGLTLTPEHLKIQTSKRMQNHILGTAASKLTRSRKKVFEIQRFLESVKKYFRDPFFVGGILLYEAEGSHGTSCKFSNSDYRVIRVFVNFVEKYLSLSRNINMKFEIYIHDTRVNDIEKIKSFWGNKLDINKNNIKVYWKRNKIIGRKDNPNYLGQMMVSVRGEKILGSKILAVSDIILRKYLRN